MFSLVTSVTAANAKPLHQGGSGGNATQIARIARIAKQSKLKIQELHFGFLAILAVLAIASKIAPLTDSSKILGLPRPQHVSSPAGARDDQIHEDEHQVVVPAGTLFSPKASVPDKDFLLDGA